MCFFSGKPV